MVIVTSEQTNRTNMSSDSSIILNRRGKKRLRVPPIYPIMLSQISVSIASGTFSSVSSVHFSFLYIVTLYVFCYIIPSYGSTKHCSSLKMSTSEKADHVVYNFCSSYRQKNHWSLLHFDTGGWRLFPRVAATMSSTQGIKKLIVSVQYRLNR